MDNFDQSTYQDAFTGLGSVNTENSIIKLLNDPNTPLEEAKHHFDKLHDISVKDSNIDRRTQTPTHHKNLYEYFLHPPKDLADQKALDDEKDLDEYTFHDYVIDSALESHTPHIFYTGALSPLLKPKHFEKVVNSKFLEQIPQTIDMPHVKYGITPFEAFAKNKNISLNTTPNHLIEKLVDHAINHKLTFGSYVQSDSQSMPSKYIGIKSLIPKLNPQHMHKILDSGILNESNAETQFSNNMRTSVFTAMAKNGDDNIRDRLLKEVNLPNENDDGSLGIQVNKDGYDPNRHYHEYIASMMEYGNPEQKNTIIIQLKSKNYKNPSNMNLREVFKKSNNEQRHYLIAHFHPSHFDDGNDGATVGLYGTADQKYHAIKRHNELNIKMARGSYLRTLISSERSTQDLIRENDNIKEENV